MKSLRLLSITVFISFSIFFMIEDKANAQSTDFGITAGINMSSHINNFRYSSGDIHLSLEPKLTTGFQGGLVFRSKISRTLRFQAEPSLMMFGASYEEPFDLRGFELQTDSQTEIISMQVPLVLQLSTAPPQQSVYGRQKATTTYHLTGGFFGGYITNARFYGTNSGAPLGVSFSGDFSNDVTSQYSNFDSGIILGIGFEYGQNSKIGLEARGQYSIIDSGDAPNLSFNPKNIAASLAAYYIF